MTKIQRLLLASLAVFAFGAIMATTASAEETLPAFWLAENKPITEKLGSFTSGEITLEDTKTIAGAAAVLCSGILVGTVGPGENDELTEVLNLKEEKIEGLGGALALLGTGAGSDCVTVKACAEGSSTSPIEVWPINLPWVSKLVLMEDGKILDLVEKAGYEILCLVLNLNTEDKCEAAVGSGFEVLNDPETGDAEVPANAIDEPLGNCEMGGAGTGVNKADALTFINLVSSELLTVSSENV